MAVLKIMAFVAAIALLIFAFFKLGQFIVGEWKKIEREEEELRQAGLRVRARSGN